jgi:NAD-dependent SIR2 family protein deacetylase
LREALRDLFAVVFAAESRGGSTALFPTFEEALGVLELAIAREEGLLGLGDSHTLGDLRRLRRELILALAAAVARDRPLADSVHGHLVDSLSQGGFLANTVFITTNYDTLLDDAIDARAVPAGRGTGSVVDYGFGGLVPVATTPHADPHRFPLLKIHGSLNWLYCPVCNVLDITYASDGVTRLIDEPEDARCPSCEALRTPVIVPPSYYKEAFNLHLSVVWNRAYHELQNAEYLVFCGYSFPDADMHVKYLVKRSQLNRDVHNHPLRVLLVNHYPGKLKEVIDAEFQRFSRFLGPEDVWDTSLSFQEFAENPGAVLAEAASR